MLSRFYIIEHVKQALQEDIGFGDITTENLASDDDIISAELNTRSNGVICGLEVFKCVFELLCSNVDIKFYFKDGDVIKKGDKIADLRGSAKALLMGERTALNYIQRMSGIATETKKYADEISQYKAKIADTRKTTPNFRAFEKYSVQMGGAVMHRFNLSDCAMIKDNHIKLAGSIFEAVRILREKISFTHKIEVECDTLDQVRCAVDSKCDIIMLDNMTLDMMSEAVDYINGRAIVEASGNVSLERIKDIASTGVDIISSSAIVAKAPTLDLALDM